MSNLEEVYRQLDARFRRMLGLPYPRDLSRVYRLMEGLDSPHRAFPAPIVTGSKGKGSTATFLASLLAGTGRRVGLFTGPHLHTYRERIKINDQEIDPASFVSLFEEVWTTVQSQPALNGVSRFEIITAMAFLYFARAGVDMAVLEVGMGGRYDAVNVAMNSPLAVFVPIEREHLYALGPTLADVVDHKAGIMRRDGQAITSPQSNEVSGQLERAAKKIGCSLWQTSELWCYQPDSLALGLVDGRLIQEFEAVGPDGQAHSIRSGLAGTFQLENALTALGAASLLTSQPLPLTALETATIAGRLEAVAYDPLVIVDGAHTPNAVRELVATLERLGGRPVWVLGFLRDKPVAEMLILLPLEGQTVFLCEIDSYRTASLEQVQSGLTRKPAQLELFGPNLAGAIEAARQVARQLPGGYVCVTGSLYMAAQTRVLMGLLDPSTANEAAFLSHLEKGPAQKSA